jgi:Enterochelin esterase and related enzymes
MSDANVKRIVRKETVPSRQLPAGARDVRISLPPGYSELTEYPVVYCQDGEDFFNFGRIATIASTLIAEGEIEPLLVVGVDVDKSVRTREYAADGDLHERYTAFFAEELVPYVAARYPVRTEPEHVLLAGCSLGGAVSLQLALAYPQRFVNVMSLSGAYYPAAQAAIASADDLSHLNIFMTVGLQETAFKTDRGVFDFVAMNREARKTLVERGANVDYFERDGEHLWGYWQKDLPDGFRWFAGI